VTAEQFIDLIWQLTGSAPITQDAPVRLGEASPELLRSTTLSAQAITHPQNPAEPTPSKEEQNQPPKKQTTPCPYFAKQWNCLRSLCEQRASPRERLPRASL
jgi:hypothetical protein